jgi:hypothetical protein
MQDITATLHALVLAMSEVHSGDQTEAHAIALAVYVAIQDGKVPHVRLAQPQDAA